MTYSNYNKKIENISKIIKQNKKLITTSRKGHNHRDLHFKKYQKDYMNITLILISFCTESDM